MKKSPVIIASALILAVGAAGTQRLRYDATVFANSEQVSQAVGRRVAQLDYPPCVRGVREDRCIQLYERGVRRSYARWRAARSAQASADTGAATRRYRPCRSRTDDNCQQVTRTRTASAARRAAPARAAARRAAPGRTASAARTRWNRAAAAQRQARAAQRQAAATQRQARTTQQRRAETAPARAATRRPAQAARSAPPAAPRQAPPPPAQSTPGI